MLSGNDAGCRRGRRMGKMKKQKFEIDGYELIEVTPVVGKGATSARVYFHKKHHGKKFKCVRVER